MAEHDWRMTHGTSPSGKVIFRCTKCQWELTAPTKGPCGRCLRCGLPLGSVGHALNCIGWRPPWLVRAEKRAEIRKDWGIA